MNAELKLFFGAATPAEARVYAQMSITGLDLRTLQLKGQLLGPTCEFSHTLPARVPFVDRSDEQSMMVEAIVPDPCFWTPELPFLYRAQLELRRGHETLWRDERSLGIRRLGLRGKWLNWDAKRFVLRGKWLRQMGNGEWGMGNTASFARETWTALIVRLPDDELCEFASRNGVLLVADLTEPNDRKFNSEINLQLQRLARWPAVAIALLDASSVLSADPRECAPNLLVAQLVRAGTPMKTATWANLIFVEVQDRAEFAHNVVDLSLPVVAVRRLRDNRSIEEARSECDSLQADLAPHGDFAGYIV